VRGAEAFPEDVMALRAFPMMNNAAQWQCLAVWCQLSEPADSNMGALTSHDISFHGLLDDQFSQF
jgi:hypothetical protein